MKLFLTSSTGGSYKVDGVRIPCALDGSNGFLELLGEHWPEDARCLILSSDPENEEMGNSFRAVLGEAFRLSNLPLSKIDVCDRRNQNKISDMLYDYDVLLLAGGHVPTQNRFFNRINLGELMISYKGLVIGISAGTMNCADVVYAQPELDGEATDPDYQRYLKGLGLTRINILPHYQEVKGLKVDGLRVVEDISLPDSKIRPFYALVDGSYIFADGSKSILYGEAYLFEGGSVRMVCGVDERVEL